MTELTIVVPTRGRPENCTRLAKAFADTCRADTELMFVVDGWDSTKDLSRDVALHYPMKTRIVLQVQEPRSSVLAINTGALATSSPYIGYMGDDVIPETIGWDALIIEHIRAGNLICWPSDGHWTDQMATAVFQDRRVSEALGYFGWPGYCHLCVDVTWADWAKAAGYQGYLDTVTVRHMHPAFGLGSTDAGYDRVNSSEMVSKDGKAYVEYQRYQFEIDVAKIRCIASR